MIEGDVQTNQNPRHQEWVSQDVMQSQQPTPPEIKDVNIHKIPD